MVRGKTIVFSSLKHLQMNSNNNLRTKIIKRRFTNHLLVHSLLTHQSTVILLSFLARFDVNNLS